jgi:hypothetical protein
MTNDYNNLDEVFQPSQQENVTVNKNGSSPDSNGECDGCDGSKGKTEEQASVDTAWLE